MQFYKLQGDLITNDINTGDRKTRKEIARSIAAKTKEFNGVNSTKYCFLLETEDDSVTFGLIVNCSINLVSFAEEYAKFIGLTVKWALPDEITFTCMQDLLSAADRHSYIDDDDEILERFGLDKLSNGYVRGFNFGENLVNDVARKEDLWDSAVKLYTGETLIPELERIYAGAKSMYAKGHPVHYIVETDDSETRRGIYRTVLNALYANNRLGSSRYAFVNFQPGDCYSHIAYEALYKISEGGAVVVRYNANDDLTEESVASSERDTIENICQMAKRYRNKVLTVLCLPRECKSLKAQFYEELGNMAFVEIKEDFIDSETAKSFLSSLAKQQHVRVDKKLFADVRDGDSYLPEALQVMFDEWYNQKLKNSIYPQYKDVVVVRKQAVKAKPKGTAYDELMEMIGLAEAKQVIKKALNYYKMQKLYEEKGVKKNNPAMHMVFSGNPGTAKTTVARLFARIMQENGLLSRGQLVEVGRGDLVGKYVGWTATVVKSKFKAASGGVLFIDEAYSLVDDRDGSFGDEAINTIVQEMENHRADVVVIFAGYPDQMERFLQKNPGLRSRIAFHVPFADYDSAELCQIADMMVKKNGMHIEKAALDKLGKAFDIVRAENDFGNGRYVRNVFEQAKMNQASRLLEKDFDAITADEITTITAEDIVIPTAKKPQKIQIGFC